jgi:hypothetical protein
MGSDVKSFEESSAQFLITRYNGGCSERLPVSMRVKTAEIEEFWERAGEKRIAEVRIGISKMAKELFAGQEDQAGALMEVFREEVEGAIDIYGARREPGLLKIERLSEKLLEQISKNLQVFLKDQNFDGGVEAHERLKTSLSQPVLFASWTFREIMRTGLTADTISDEEGSSEPPDGRNHGEATRKAFNRVFLARLDEKVQNLLKKNGITQGIRGRYYFGSGLGFYLAVSAEGTSNGDFNIGPSEKSHEPPLPRYTGA